MGIFSADENESTPPSKIVVEHRIISEGRYMGNWKNNLVAVEHRFAEIGIALSEMSLRLKVTGDRLEKAFKDLEATRVQIVEVRKHYETFKP